LYLDDGVYGAVTGLCGDSRRHVTDARYVTHHCNVPNYVYDNNQL